MIYTITTTELMKYYSKMPLEVIEKTNYIIISTRVRITKERNNVLMAAPMFINSGMLKGVGSEMESDSPLTREKFKKYLLTQPKPMGLFSAAIEATLTADENTLLICSPNEMKVGYMDVIADVVSELWDFPICRFPDQESYDVESVLKRCIYYKKEIHKLHLKKMSRVEVRKYIQKLSKKELRKELKERKRYEDGLSREEMEAILEEYFKEV